ncbi:MAG: hypothetical protein AMDU2_EPLC00005G0006 [Thermoplasmatales archaeon E-plasma]|nr:MAG: hypothetical protein AMDU2_EPLC00005G0006 [Thermoplasmatales archaeon E-plasma]
MDKMKIAIIIPYLHKIEGNKTALLLASQLMKEGNDVFLIIWKIKSTIYEDLTEKYPDLKIKYHKILKKGKFGIIFAIKYQLLKGVDRKLSNMILNEEKSSMFDFVIVPSNEGKWIGQYIKKSELKEKPITMVTVMELHENGMLMYHRKKGIKIASLLFYPLFFILQIFEDERIKSFDIITVNSKWTANSLSYFYGLNSQIVVNHYDSEVFKVHKEYEKIDVKYIAVPTISITEKHKRIIQKLLKDGINIIAFGKRKIDTENYLGFVTDEKLRDILTNASATLFLFDYEAFGLIPLESLICGTPVITEPKLGVFAEYNDCPDVHFAEKYEDIKKLCNSFLNSEKSSESIKRCIEWAKQYDPEIVTKKILHAYENARK